MLYNHVTIELIAINLDTMNFFVNFIFVLAKCSLILAAFTIRWEVPQGRIVGGHEAVPHAHPYLVSLQTRFLWVRLHICGGSLLNENWILTAGHCVKGSWLINWLPLDAVAGTHDVVNFGRQAQVITINKRIPHPFYKGDIGPYDIALLKTKTPFTFTKEIQPINLPINSKINAQNLILAGWGVLRTTVFFPDMPTKLQEVNVTYIPYEECYKAVENIKDDDEDNPLDKDANICSGPTTGGIAACNGDSGGPLIQYTSDPMEEITNDPIQENESDYIDNSVPGNNEEDNNNVENEQSKKQQVPVVLGIVSWGATPCGDKGAPTVYTKVSTYIDFVNRYINT